MRSRNLLLVLAACVPAISAADPEGYPSDWGLKICTSQNDGADCYSEKPVFNKCTGIKDPARYGDRGSSFMMKGPKTGDHMFWCRVFQNKDCKDQDDQGKMNTDGIRSVWVHMTEPGFKEWNSDWVYQAYLCGNGAAQKGH